jgi:hypothetical protein
MNIIWYECEIPESEVIEGDALVEIQELFEDALESPEWPANAAVFTEAELTCDSVKLWMTEDASYIAEKAGFEWRKYYVRDLPEAPLKKDAALLVGLPSAWDLLKE